MFVDRLRLLSVDEAERLFLGFCTKQGYRLLKQLGVDELREFRNSLVKKCAASSAQTRLEYVRGFLRFCQASGWISANPALAVKPPRSDSSPTLPFDEAEIETMLAAADTFTVKGNFGAGNRKRVRSMILLLRYSGLRISDASTLERSRLKGTKLFLYTQKTGTPVWVPLATEGGRRAARIAQRREILLLERPLPSHIHSKNLGDNVQDRV